MSHIIHALNDVFGDERPAFTEIVVSKRIKTKFFTEGGRPDNPPPGTIVDDVVTLPERHDFYLISQSVNQGTVNPTSYHVIHNESGYKPDIIQRLTYKVSLLRKSRVLKQLLMDLFNVQFKLCHLYFNWSGTVRVPAVCQYAHKLAYLIGESVHQPPSAHLNEFLYFL